jgi:hypothetical protein
MVEPFVMHYNASPVIRSLAHRPNCRVCAGSARPDRRSVDLWRRAQFNCDSVRIVSLSIAGCLGNSREQGVDAVSMLLWALAIIAGAFVAYNLFHYVLFLLATHPKDAGGIGHVLNEFEQRQLVEWVPKTDDFLKHDDENRTYDDVFGPYRGEFDNYSTCVFPRSAFTHPYESDLALIAPADGMPASVRSRSHASPIPPCKRRSAGENSRSSAGASA